MAILTVLLTFFYVKNLKINLTKKNFKEENIGTFLKQSSCARHPNFLRKLKIPQPIAIDLSQKQYKGLAFLYGQALSEALHLKTWEKFDHFSTYTLDLNGNMFLTPMPFISVKEKTFEFQKNIYKLDTNSGRLSIWISLDDVKAGGNNPYGVISLDYDCDDHSLWVSAIDESSYSQNRGVIYHIDIKTQKILQELHGIDALSIKLIKTKKGKFLLAGFADENALYSFQIKDNKLGKNPKKLFELPFVNEKIRKIKIHSNKFLELQTIPFGYTLVAQTEEDGIRKNYNYQWDEDLKRWSVIIK